MDEHGQASLSEDLRVRSYLNTELMVAKLRWFVIAFLTVYLFTFRPAGWPTGLFASLLGIAALYNFALFCHITKAKFFSPWLSLLFMFCDLGGVAVGLNFTGGIRSPFVFIWYLTLVTAGVRFGFLRSLILQAPMAFFYTAFFLQGGGFAETTLMHQWVVGLFSFVAVSLFGSIFSHEEKFIMKLMTSFHKASITDRLTGLHNYAYFMDELKREQARADRTGSHFSLVIFDLDRFKQVNDTYGHEKGNVLLQEVADILRASARKMDVVARYGGEEFVILMPDSNDAEMEVAERIRARIEQAEFKGIAENPLKITISGGVCTYPRDAASVNDLLDNADKALYQAKTCGRNRTWLCEPIKR